MRRHERGLTHYQYLYWSWATIWIKPAIFFVMEQNNYMHTWTLHVPITYEPWELWLHQPAWWTGEAEENCVIPENSFLLTWGSSAYIRSVSHYTARTCATLSRQLCVDVLICQTLHHFTLGRTLRCFMSQQEHFGNMACIMYVCGCGSVFAQWCNTPISGARNLSAWWNLLIPRFSVFCCTYAAAVFRCVTYMCCISSFLIVIGRLFWMN